MRFLRRSLVGLILVSLTLGLLGYAGFMMKTAIQERMAREQRVRPPRERVFAANVVTATARSETPILFGFGEVRAQRTLDLRATIAGQVVDLSPDFVEGGRVERGSLLARIDPRDAQSTLDVALVDLTRAHEDVSEAKTTLDLAGSELAASREQARLRRQALDRQTGLRDRGVGTEAAVETAALAAASADQAVVARQQAVAQAKAGLSQARTALARQEIAVAQARRSLADTEIRAEFTGVLSEVAAVQGGLVNANERLARLIDPAHLEVAFRVSTEHYTRLLDNTGNVGAVPVRAVLEVSGFSVEARGRLSRASGAVEEGQTGRLLFATLDDPAGFRPGDFVSVQVTEPALDRVARLPASAVDGQGTVLALGDDDRLEQIAVVVSRRQGDEVLVRGEEVFGREIVAERVPQLGAGIKIKPIRFQPAEPDQEPPMVELTEERRQKLITFVRESSGMPEEVRKRLVTRLQAPAVPADMIDRLEQRMGG